ncbi:MAG TPA: hypothetical protein VEA69_09010 [Tepidisphaeraceae bacterium]|nr:hypothetical protein [Tepidisphaeraceae bacterium]
MLNDFFADATDPLNEIGQTGLDEIEQLRDHLIGLGFVSADPNQDIRFRFAPSIVTRSEAELLGLSMPRFALRAYFGGTCRSFANIRRLETMAKQVTRWGKRRNAGPDWLPAPEFKHVRDPDKVKDLHAVIRNSKCIADCVLAPPAALSDEYHVLQVELGMAYGESAPVRGTPFMNHVSLSGLCAQAVSLMAGALLHDFPVASRAALRPGVQGVAEVSAAIKGDAANELRLTGMRLAEIVDYFTRVGRGAWEQRAAETRKGRTEAELFALSLRAYVRSGIPVILPVNSARLGDAIDRRVGGRDHDRPPPPAAALGAPPDAATADGTDHAILVVGVGKTAETADRFLINDPAKLPFMKITGAELYDCASGEATEGLFVAVTPDEVRIGMETAAHPRDGHRPAGILDLAHAAQPPASAWPTRAKFEPGEFELIRCRDLGLSRLPVPHPVRQVLIDWARAAQADPDHFYWLQYVPEGDYGGAWLWEAQAPAPNRVLEYRIDFPDSARSIALGMLRGRVDVTGKVLQMADLARPRPAPAPSGPADPPPADAPLPVPALISSFSLHGVQDQVDRHVWPLGVPCELYAFMHKDKLLDLFPDDVTAGATARMADMADQPDADLGTIATTIADLLARRDSRVVAFASFLPEMVHPPGEPAGPHAATDRGRRAVTFLLRLARSLHALNREHERSRRPHDSHDPRPFVVELTGGSRVGRVWQAHVTELGVPAEDALVVNRYHQRSVGRRLVADQAVDALVDGLAHVVRAAHLTPDDGVVLALEMEPGGNFNLRDIETLEYFCAKIAADPVLAPVCGVNLDVSHWALCGVDPVSFPTRYKSVFERVVHAHVSDVGQAHFGDAPVGDVGLGDGAHARAAIPGDRPREMGTLDWFKACVHAYRPWLELLLRVGAAARHRPATLPRYSGYVSVELEACRSPYQPLVSVGRLRSLIGAIALER